MPADNPGVEQRVRDLVGAWLATLTPESRAALYLLLEELCSGLDVSRHNRFGFLRLRAEFETSGELFGCSLEDLRDAVAEALGPELPHRDRPPSALETLRERISSEGHPDFH